MNRRVYFINTVGSEVKPTNNIHHTERSLNNQKSNNLARFASVLPWENGNSFVNISLLYR